MAAKSLKKVTVKSLINQIERVPLRSLKTHPENNNVREDLSDIIESLEETGLYKPLVVQKSTKYVCAGNHVFLAAKKMGWSEIDAVMLDIDDTTARRILLGDNKIGMGASLDEQLTAELLSKIPDAHIATGFKKSEVDELLRSMNKTLNETLATVEDVRASATEAEQDITDNDDDDDPLGATTPIARDDDQDGDDEDGTTTELTKAKDEIEGAYTLKDEIPDDYVGYWQIPRLRTDMLMTFDEIPKNLQAWAGSATKDNDDPKQWWLYNWGIDSTSGMKQDFSQVIIGFYCWDDYFENWWHYPERHVARLLNSKIRYAVTPNYSQWTAQSNAANLWALYRSRWLGRYMQECGIKVIPDINWPMGDTDYLEKYVLGTLPKNLPLISLQMQTFNEDELPGGAKGHAKEVQRIFDILKPQGLLFYSGEPGRRFLRKHIVAGCPVFDIETRITKLAEAQKRKSKKTTI